MPSDSPSHAPETRAPATSWRLNLALFVATVASVFFTQAGGQNGITRDSLINAGMFTISLLSILLAHEFGHYIAAKIHRVDATLPFFIPMPILSLLGTMGAVIRMRGTIPTRKALLDIGAAGPLAGLAVAIPMYIWGIQHSSVVATDNTAGMHMLGESLLTKFADRRWGPAVVSGQQEILLSPVAFAAWGGFLVTMINLIPVGQLDGGHVAYALFGKRQDRIAQWVHRSTLVFFFVSLIGYASRDVRAGIGLVRMGEHVANSLFWLVWFGIMGVLGSLSRPSGSTERVLRPGDREPLSWRQRLLAVMGLALMASFGGEASSFFWMMWFVGLGMYITMEVRWGAFRDDHLLDHPPTSPEPLGFVRATVAIITLLFFVLLFMPTPISM